MRSISPELAEILNPDNKALTTKQWQQRLDKYEKKKAKQQRHQSSGEQPGVCKCGQRTFELRVIAGGGIERTCKNEDCGDVKIL